MHDDVDLAAQCRRERRGVVREKVVAASTSLDTRLRREVEAEVRVGEQEDAEACGHGWNLCDHRALAVRRWWYGRRTANVSVDITDRIMTVSTCKVVPSGAAYLGQQGFTYLAGLTGSTVGSRGICMTLVTLPDGARAKPHLHRDIETAVYVLEGEAEMHFGERLGELVCARAGEYLYIPADMPHLVVNRSGAECRALVAHTAADDQVGIVLLPELDELV